MCSTMYQKAPCLAGTGVWKISSVARGFSSIKIDYSYYLKSLISRINEVYVFEKTKTLFIAVFLLVIVLTWFL